MRIVIRSVFWLRDLGSNIYTIVASEELEVACTVIRVSFVVWTMRNHYLLTLGQAYTSTIRWSDDRTTGYTRLEIGLFGLYSYIISERCIAKRANGEQCSRRKRGDSSYCGTHIKGVPHGVVSMEETEVVSQKEVWCEDIAGIIQYIDKDGNIYKHEDVMNNVVNPSIIGKYEIVADKYVIRQD